MMTTGMLEYKSAAKTIAYYAKWYLDKQDKELILDGEIQRLYRLLTLYFTGNKEFEKYYLETNSGKIYYSLKKGILLIGPKGRSKTFCFERLFRVFTNRHNQEKSYKITSAYKIQKSFEIEGSRAVDQYLIWENLYIDDIGKEELNVKHFGNNQAPMQTLLYYRHKIFMDSLFEVKTHASTNLVFKPDHKESIQVYYEEMYSKMIEMFNVIITTGNNLRIDLKNE